MLTGTAVGNGVVGYVIALVLVSGHVAVVRTAGRGDWLSWTADAAGASPPSAGWPCAARQPMQMRAVATRMGSRADARHRSELDNETARFVFEASMALALVRFLRMLAGRGGGSL
ncbi:hypothetical protein ACGFX8_34160 [Streptomyces sp. NPDC048362]|uniref:hypothetical protein n=1 Tax=Streptomyces sp. NPDC048362 TaxID=3365539 RepID=UPI003710E189